MNPTNRGEGSQRETGGEFAPRLYHAASIIGVSSSLVRRTMCGRDQLPSNQRVNFFAFNPASAKAWLTVLA